MHMEKHHAKELEERKAEQAELNKAIDEERRQYEAKVGSKRSGHSWDERRRQQWPLGSTFVLVAAVVEH